LEITLQDLSSVTKFIQLLQEDMNAKRDLGAISAKETKETISILDLNFERVNIKHRINVNI